MTTLDRRTFLKLTGAGAGSLALGGARGLEATASTAGPLMQTSANTTTDVAVIGAGAFGGWTALHLLEMGLSVTLIDAYGPGNARAASGGESRQITGSYKIGESEVYARWAMEAFGRWEKREAEWGGRKLIRRTGQLSLNREWTTRMRANDEMMERRGYEREIIAHDDLPRRFPQFNNEGYEFGYYVPSTGVIMAKQGCLAVAEAFQRQGGQFILAKATPGAQSGGQLQEVSLSTGQTVRAEQFVFACGPWLPQVLPNPMKDRMVTPRRVTFWFGVPMDDHRFTYPNCPNWSVRGAYGFPNIEGRGFKVATSFNSLPFDPDTGERIVTADELRRAHELVGTAFPALKGQPLLESRVCQYERSVDGHFIVDKHPEMSNAWIVGGGSGHGYKHGIMLGESAALRVTGGKTDPEDDETFKLQEETF